VSGAAAGDPAGRDALVVLVSVPDAESGAELARALVEAGLAACVTRLPGAVSTYRWQGAIETAAEELLVVKTTSRRWPALRDAIRRQHPYDVPEILALRVEAGLEEYLAWLDAAATGSTTDPPIAGDPGAP
jgi:periplasmic divalent cation tolerance protein